MFFEKAFADPFSSVKIKLWFRDDGYAVVYAYSPSIKPTDSILVSCFKDPGTTHEKDLFPLIYNKNKMPSSWRPRTEASIRGAAATNFTEYSRADRGETVCITGFVHPVYDVVLKDESLQQAISRMYALLLKQARRAVLFTLFLTYQAHP